MPASLLLVTMLVPTLMAAGLAVARLTTRRPAPVPIPSRARRRLSR